MQSSPLTLLQSKVLMLTHCKKNTVEKFNDIILNQFFNIASKIFNKPFLLFLSDLLPAVYPGPEWEHTPPELHGNVCRPSCFQTEHFLELLHFESKLLVRRMQRNPVVVIIRWIFSYENIIEFIFYVILNLHECKALAWLISRLIIHPSEDIWDYMLALRNWTIVLCLQYMWIHFYNRVFICTS